YTAFQGTPQEFWAQLSQDAEFKTVIPGIQLQCQVAVLTLNHPQAANAIQTAYKPSSLMELAKALDRATLTQLLTSLKISAPVSVAGSSPAEQLTNYVNGVVGLLEAAFPTVYVAKGLAASADTTLQAVAKILANVPINFGSTDIPTY